MYVKCTASVSYTHYTHKLFEHFLQCIVTVFHNEYAYSPDDEGAAVLLTNFAIDW